MSTITRRILIVDDNEGLTRLLAKLLARIGGHVVEQAFDGPSALAAYERFRPEVVLLDIGLPGMNGHEVAQKLRATCEGQQTLLVALTGFGEEQDRELSLASGFDLHLVKPASIAELESLFSHPKLSSPPGDSAS